MLKNYVECLNIGFSVWGEGTLSFYLLLLYYLLIFFPLLLKFCAPRHFAPGVTAPLAPPTLRLCEGLWAVTFVGVANFTKTAWCALRAHLGVGENYFLGPQKKFLCMQGSTQRGGGGGCCPPEIFKAKTNIHSDFRFSNSCISWSEHRAT